MSVPPLRLHNNFEPYISGEVTIHPSAVLAPGVILQAATNSKIIIGPGVCIGMGSILQVNEGTLEVEAGANLGAGFLMVGGGKIGTNACIGAATTVFNCSVEPGTVVPPSSVLGDTSRQISLAEPQELPTNNPPTNAQQPPAEDNNLGGNEEKVISISSTNLSASAFLELKHHSVSVPQPSPTPSAQPPPSEEDTTADSASEHSAENSESSDIFGTQIYGQGSIHRLLTTLFPHRQSLNHPKSDEPPE